MGRKFSFFVPGGGVNQNTTRNAMFLGGGEDRGSISLKGEEKSLYRRELGKGEEGVLLIEKTQRGT